MYNNIILFKFVPMLLHPVYDIVCIVPNVSLVQRFYHNNITNVYNYCVYIYI